LSNLHHTANASTNTPIHENLSSSPFLTSPMTNKSVSTELGAISIPTKITNSSASSLIPTTTGNLTNKINKISSNINQQDSSLVNFNSRIETNQESTPISEKKTFIVSYS
jgi:hypothetical protein